MTAGRRCHSLRHTTRLLSILIKKTMFFSSTTITAWTAQREEGDGTTACSNIETTSPVHGV